MKKILLVASQHGNERLGDALFTYIKTIRTELLPFIEFTIANPAAYKQNIRFIESDMNRSFNSSLNTYESARARRLLKKIENGGYSVILDLHTTACKQPPCFIVKDLNKDTLMFLAASSIQNIVLMKDTIVENSLIGNVPHSISIEVSTKDISNALLGELCDDIFRYVRNEKSNKTHFTYIVSELLLKTDITEDRAQSLVNFEMSSYGFVPVLVGENSYKKDTHYLGFKAGEKTAVTL